MLTFSLSIDALADAARSLTDHQAVPLLLHAGYGSPGPLRVFVKF